MKKLILVLACLDIVVLALLLMGYPQRWFQTEPLEESSSSNIMYYTPVALNLLDVDLDLLPEADQILLREGIRVTDRDRLNRLIEDYES